MKKREAKYQTLFNKYLRKTGMLGYFELKQTKAKSIPWSAIQPHQLAGLLAAREGGLVWKLSDEDQRRKPFDCFSVPALEAYVVVFFGATCCIIPIKTFLYAKDRSEDPSLSMEFAEDLAIKVIHT